MLGHPRAPQCGSPSNMITLRSLVAGAPVSGSGSLDVVHPFDGSRVGSVALASRADTDAAVSAALAFRDTPSRHQRSEILDRTRAALEVRREEFARTIALEAGLALREGRYEVGRTLDVLRFASIEALRDDGQIFSCDISAQGKSRKIFTTREPLRCAVAITPSTTPQSGGAQGGAGHCRRDADHPQALGKTPLVALMLAELLYAAGLPGPMLSVLLGPTAEVAEPLVRHPEVELVAFTGVWPSASALRRRRATKLVLELGAMIP